MERVLADIDADDGDYLMNCLRHGVLLVFGAPLPAYLLTGQEHGRTIPLTDIAHNAGYVEYLKLLEYPMPVANRPDL
jgi:hypothetical protein